MLRPLAPLLLLLAAPAAWCAIWPQQLNGLTRGKVTTVTLPDASLAGEYGFEAGERAEYGDGKLLATAWRARDSTGALAILDWLEGEKPQPKGLTRLGNYILEFQGPKPAGNEFDKLYVVLPRLEQSPLPALPGFLPKDAIPGSARYILGPVALAKFVPSIPPSVAGFHFGTEGETLEYKTKAGPLRLTVFSYPSHQIARAQMPEFQKLSNVMVKRDGPLIAVVTSAPTRDAAEIVLSKVRYQAQVTWNERTPNQQVRSIGSMLLSIFALAGIVIVFCLAAGLLFSAIRLLQRKLSGTKGEPEAMIVLHIDDQQRR